MDKPLRNFVLPEKIRTLVRLVPFFGMPLWLFSAAVLVMVFVHPETFVRYLVLAVIFTALSVWLTYMSIVVPKSVSVEYHISRCSVSNENKKTKMKNAINLNEPYYLTQIISEHVIGKSATIELPQILFSQNPFPELKNPYGSSLVKYMRFAEKQIVVIPLDTQTGAWLADDLHISRVPEYPKVLCKTVASQTPEDNLQLW